MASNFLILAKISKFWLKKGSGSWILGSRFFLTMLGTSFGESQITSRLGNHKLQARWDHQIRTQVFLEVTARDGLWVGWVGRRSYSREKWFTVISFWPFVNHLLRHKTILQSCDNWDTDYNSYNWEPEFMTIFVTWQSRVTLDSIRNSCDVFRDTLYVYLVLKCYVDL